MGLEVSLWAWGNYIYTRWHNVSYFCQGCFDSRVIPRLVAHANPCGCSFAMNARFGYGPLPSWIRFEQKRESCAA